MNSINIQSYGAIPDGITNCTTALNNAVAAAIAANISTVYIPGGVSAYIYRFTSKPNAIAGNIRLISEKSETCILLRDYNASSASEPFLDISNGGGCEGIQICAANGTTGGIGLVSKPASTSGFQNFYNIYVTINGSGAWGDAAALLSGADAPDGLRDIHFSDNFIFGKLIIDHVINIGGSGNYAGNVVLRATNASSDPSANIMLDFIAANSLNISNCYNFNINCGYVQNSIGCITLSSTAVNGRITVGNNILQSNISNSSNSTGIYSSSNIGTEGIWTPSPSGLTVVGVPTYTGKWKRIGSVVFFSLTISSTGYTTSVSGQTYFTGLPIAPIETAAATAVNANRTSIGGVHVTAGALYMPSWSGEVGIVINGFYFV